MRALEELLKGYAKNIGNKPYAIFCNKKTFKIIEQEMREHELVPHDPYNFSKYKNVPTEMYYNGIPIFTNELCPDDKIYLLGEKTSLKIRASSLGFEVEEKRQAEKASKTIQDELIKSLKERYAKGGLAGLLISKKSRKGE